MKGDEISHGDYIFYIATICFSVGVITGLLEISLVHIVLGVMFVVVLIVNSSLGNKKLVTTLSVALVFLGFIRADISVLGHASNPLDVRAGERITLQGVVNQEIDIRDNSVQLTVYSEQYDVQILLRTTFYPRYTYGDEIVFMGTLDIPKSFEGETGRVFDYPNYLLKDNIRYVMWYPQIELIQHDQGNIIKRTLLDIKHSLIYQIESILPEPHSSLLGGLLLGAKSTMGKQLLDDFRITGVIHIVVLSGFNITIVAWFFITIFSFLGQRAVTYLATGAIFCFAIMTGAGATVVRASLMAILVIIAKATGNYAHVLRMLALTGVLMVLWNPMILLYDPGFQLSFVAAFGLITLAPVIERYTQFLYEGRWIQLRSLVAGTLATQIMVTPALLYMMGTYPTYAPITNFLILSMVPFTMAIGMVATLLSYISNVLALPFTTITYMSLKYDLWVVDVFANVPFASFDLPPFSFMWVVLAYAIYALIGYIWYKKTKS